MSAITDRILDAWEKHQRPRLHSGMMDKEPILVTEYPKPPEFLILCQKNWNDLRRDSGVDGMQIFMTQKFMNMTVCVIQGRYDDIPDTVEVK